MKLEVKGVTKKYGNKLAVDHLNFSFNSGIYGLLGANGAGKSTLMRMICGILKPSEGKISLDGNNINDLGEKYREILGYLPQNFGYYQDFTASEFLYYMAALKGLKSSNAKKKTKQLLEELNLSKVANNKIKTFSGGMKQRIGIAQALLNNPQILVLDEPTAGLDPKERVKFRRLISQFAKDKIVILSTHIVSDVEDIADTIIIMKEGRFVLTGSNDHVVEELDGKVWEFMLPEEELEMAENSYNIANMHHHDKILEIRAINDVKPHENAKLVKPRLEDLYLCYFDSSDIEKEQSYE